MVTGEEEPEVRSGEPDTNLYREVISNSVIGWSLFVDTAIESNIYSVARESYDPQKAARIALFRLYLEGFNPEERKNLLEKPDYFLQYAFGVVRELYPPHPKNRRTILHNRLVFMTSGKAVSGQRTQNVNGSLQGSGSNPSGCQPDVTISRGNCASQGSL